MWQYFVSTPSYPSLPLAHPSTFPFSLFKIQPPSVRILQFSVQNKMGTGSYVLYSVLFQKIQRFCLLRWILKAPHLLFSVYFLCTLYIYIYIHLIFWKYSNQWQIFLLLCLFEMMQEAKWKYRGVWSENTTQTVPPSRPVLSGAVLRN